MTAGQHKRTFGRRKEPHTVIIARGSSVRHFTVRPWVLALGTFCLSALAVGSLGAGSYFYMNGELAASASAQYSDMQLAYESRIAALRAQLDRVTSRQLLDQKLVETKVEVLLDQQEELTERYVKLQPLLDRARETGILPAEMPLPTWKPAQESAALPPERPDGSALLLSYSPTITNDSFAPLLGSPSTTSDVTAPAAAGEAPKGTADDRHVDLSDALIRQVGQSIDYVEERQLAHLQELTAGARATTEKIASAFEAEGIALPFHAGQEGVGGPFVPVVPADPFELRVERLDEALDRLDRLREGARRLPLSSPVAKPRITSRFGVRRDPFLGRSALHTGMDFAGAAGTLVEAPAGGKVVFAGTNGGYGKMVEIDHGGGLVTRYAHLSRISVDRGQELRPGDKIGTVGSTGRSTGPHLHYEVRRNGKPVDPAKFLRAGKSVASLL